MRARFMALSTLCWTRTGEIATLFAVKVEKQKFDAVLASLLAAPPLKKSEIVTDPKRGRPRKTAPKRKPSR